MPGVAWCPPGWRVNMTTPADQSGPGRATSSAHGPSQRGSISTTAQTVSGNYNINGAVNLPIVHYSVVWWNSLHQGETIFTPGGPKAAAVYLWPMALMCFAYFAAFGALWMERVRGEIWRRRAGALAVQGAR